MRILIPFLAGCLVASGANPWWFLENRPYYEVIPAEPHVARTAVLFPSLSDATPFVVNPGRRLAWNIDIGREIPIVGFETKRGGGDDAVAPGGFGLGLWFPLSFHMIEDMGKDPSNPILDTDYRFSGMLKGQYGLADGKAGADSSAIGFRLQFGHESTHIGDEFTVNAIRLYPTDFRRVNVSFEYWDAGGSYEPTYASAHAMHHVKMRAGVIGLFNPGKGWYSPELLYPLGLIIAGSKRNIEPYVQAEWYREHESKKMGAFVSADLRNRTVYNYAKASRDVPEDTEWSFNLLVGCRQKATGTGKFGKVRPEYSVRYYHGVNPAGQFRSQKDYTLFGFGVGFGF